MNKLFFVPHLHTGWFHESVLIGPSFKNLSLCVGRYLSRQKLTIFLQFRLRRPCVAHLHIEKPFRFSSLPHPNACPKLRLTYMCEFNGRQIHYVLRQGLTP